MNSFKAGHNDMESTSVDHKKQIRRVLFVAYQFPPAGGIGVHRVVKFIKFLPEFGWESSVLTVSNPSVPLTDHSLVQDIPDSTRVVRAKTYEPSYGWKQKVSASHTDSGKKKSSGLLKRTVRQFANTLFQPDLQILWSPQAIRAGLKLLKEVPHDAIVATAPPFSSFYVGEQLAKKTGLPLILDYRDEWGISNNYWENKQQGFVSRYLQTRLQHRLLRRAKAAIATTPSSCRSVADTAHDAGSDAACEYIYNGFDPDDFPKSTQPLLKKDYGNGTDLFRLVYAGTLWNLNSVEPLVRAIEQLSTEAPALIERLEFVVAGRRTADQETILERISQLRCRLVRLPFVGHDEAIQLMQTADCLVLLNSSLPGAERIVNGKIFEYLASEKPFLLISPPGDMWQLTEDCPYALPCDPQQPQKIQKLLAHEIECHRVGVQREASLWTPKNFERRPRAAQLAEILERVIIPSKQTQISDSNSQTYTGNASR